MSFFFIILIAVLAFCFVVVITIVPYRYSRIFYRSLLIRVLLLSISILFFVVCDYDYDSSLLNCWYLLLAAGFWFYIYFFSIQAKAKTITKAKNDFCIVLCNQEKHLAAILIIDLVAQSVFVVRSNHYYLTFIVELMHSYCEFCLEGSIAVGGGNWGPYPHGLENLKLAESHLIVCNYKGGLYYRMFSLLAQLLNSEVG